MRKYIALFLVLIAAFGLAAGGSSEAAVADDGTILIGVSKLLSHAALDAVETGLQDYLATTDLNVRYDFQNANGDISTAASIAQQFDSENCDVVVGIGTASAQALANVFTDIPVLFAAVTDPVDAGLVASNEGSPDSNVCGVSDMNPVEEQIKLLHDITGATRIGNVYSSPLVQPSPISSNLASSATVVAVPTVLFVYVPKSVTKYDPSTLFSSDQSLPLERFTPINAPQVSASATMLPAL